MRFSEAWLREWVNPDINTDALADQLSMAGLEVDSVEPAAPAFSGVVVGGLVVAAVLAIVAAPLQLLEFQWTYSGRPGRVSTSSAAAMIGNEEIAREVMKRLRPGEIMASSSYTNVHLLSFLSGGALETRLANVNNGLHGLASLYWHEPDDLVGRDFLFIAHDRRGDLHVPLSKIFGGTDGNDSLPVPEDRAVAHDRRPVEARDHCPRSEQSEASRWGRCRGHSESLRIHAPHPAGAKSSRPSAFRSKTGVPRTKVARTRPVNS